MEHGSGVHQEIWVSEIELPWLCLILEDASLDYNKDFVRSYGGFARKIQARRLVLEGGFVLRVEVRDSGRGWYVLLPELCGNGGWVDILKKIWAFCGYRRTEGIVDGRSFLEAASIGGWPENTVAVEEKGKNEGVAMGMLRADSTLE